MAYIDAGADPAARTKAAAWVIAIHALLGAGLVLGLAVKEVLQPAPPPITGTEVKLDPPPLPDDPIPEPADTSVYVAPQNPTPPIVLTPLPPIPMPPVSNDSSEVTRIVIPPRPSSTPGPVASPAPTPAFTPVAARPANNMQSWITTDDYSRSNLTREREGTARYRLVVGSNGRVDACEITSSTGHASLDTATCRLIERRARFDPATNNRGERVVGTYTGSVTWQIPE
ncbi:MAG: TonB family protein [Erythrobacter sp.]|nr:MAG: TonB family protein [Erythrobacter sp.]